MIRRIETERLILRTVTVDDADAIFKWASDPDVNKYMIYPLHPNTEATKEWLKSRDIDGNDEFDLGFVLKETGEVMNWSDFIINVKKGKMSRTLDFETGESLHEKILRGLNNDKTGNS